MQNNIWLVLAVVVVVLVVAVSLRPASVIETDDYIWVERGTTVIPGFAIGIPTSQTEFQAIKVRRADVTLKHSEVLDGISIILHRRTDTVLLLAMKAPRSGAVILAVDQRLKDYVWRLAEMLGLGDGGADHERSTQGYWVLIFYGQQQE